jgi:ElaB/YqjD/DUF883 family membrane-anchored ribosome-binding protein
MDTPQVHDVLALLGGMAGAVLAIVAVIVLLKKWLLGDLRSDIDDVRSQLRRNGGTSLRDAVDRIEERQTDIASEVRRATERLDDHITYHLEEKK